MLENEPARRYLYMSCILLYINNARGTAVANFFRADIRLSSSRKIVKTNHCLLKEECALRCLIDTDCHSVRLFPVEKGFMSEHLTLEAGFNDPRRAYEHLNGECLTRTFSVSSNMQHSRKILMRLLKVL